MGAAPCLVTGGAGFIGSHVAEELVKRGHPVRVVDNLSTGTEANLSHLRGDLELVIGDLRDPATLVGRRRAMGQERTTPEIVLFVAGDMHEHLGQLIAYARMNRIVPPWSK